MDEDRARRVAERLGDYGISAYVAESRAGWVQFGVRVVLSDGREVLWDTDGTAGLEAQVFRDGMLVGFVPVIEGSEKYPESQIVDVIALIDYDNPATWPRRPRASLTRVSSNSGRLRRFIEGFRE